VIEALLAFIAVVPELAKLAGPIGDLIKALDGDEEAAERVADVLAEKSASRTVLEKLKAQRDS